MRGPVLPRLARPCCALTLVLLLLAALPAPAGALIFYFWQSPVSGSADEVAKWNPDGLPTAQDDMLFNVAGTYTVTFPGTVPASTQISCGGGTPTWSVASPHTTGLLLVGANSGQPTLTVSQGTINTDLLILGGAGSFSKLTLTNGGQFGSRAVVHSKSRYNAVYGSGDEIGRDGVSEMTVNGGAQYYCDIVEADSQPLVMGEIQFAATTLFIAGSSPPPRIYSGVHVTHSIPGSVPALIVGHIGVANLFAYNGGYLDVIGGMVIGAILGSAGYVTIGPVSGLGTSSLHVQDHLSIGLNAYPLQLGGHGELTVENGAWVQVDHGCEVGDPDGDTGSVLRVKQGGNFRVLAEGLTIWPTAGPGLDVRGGVVRVNGGLTIWRSTGPGFDFRDGLIHVMRGAFVWPAGRYLSISSQVGAPELRISGGVTTTGPNTPVGSPQLLVGRGGTGILRITQSDTQFSMGAGVTTLGDSLGGVGTILADSSAAILGGGPVNVGLRGRGELDLQHFSSTHLGTLAIGVTASGVGNVRVSDYAQLGVLDNLWVGGGFGLAGGSGSLVADSFAWVRVEHGAGAGPPLTAIYSPGGSLTLAGGALLSSPGIVDDMGNVILRDGQIQVPTVSVEGSGSLGGWGLVWGGLFNHGRIDPYSASNAFGRLSVRGNLTQSPLGHYVVDLGALRCDSLAVNGAIVLSGALDLRLDPEFVYSGSNTFTILTATSRAGVFDAVTWNGSPLAGQASVVYLPTAVQVVVTGGVTGVDPAADSAAATSLCFAPAGGLASLAFELELPARAEVQVKLYNVSGRQVATLYTGTLEPGPHRLEPQGAGVSRLPSGAYFARAVIQSGGQTTVRSARSIVVH